MNFDICFPLCNDVDEGHVNDDRTDELIWFDIMAGEFLPIIRRRQRPRPLGICEISASASNIMVSAHSLRGWATIKLL